MKRKVLGSVLALGFLGSVVGVHGQVTSDPEVAKGIKQVDEGEYDGAILTLDTAARRLSGDPSRVKDLSQAYLYLGIAYVGKGHEAAAKAKFREAVRQIKDMSLSPDKFPPRVIDLFEAAKEEAGRAPAAAASVAAAPAKKGGSKKGLIIGGAVLAAAGGGVAIAAGGGGNGAAGSNSVCSAQTFGPLALSLDDYSREFSVFVAKAGTLDATVTWNERDAILSMYAADSTGDGNVIANSNQTGNTESRMTGPVNQLANGQPQKYIIAVFHGGSSKTTATMTLRVVCR